MSDISKGILYGFIAVIGFSLTLPVTIMMLPYLDPVFVAFGRSSFAAVVAGILLVLFSDAFPSKKQLFQLFVVAFGIILGFPLFTTMAMETVPASHGAIVVGIMPLSTAIAGALIGHEKPGLLFWGISLAGTILVISYTLLQNNGSFQKADIYLFAATVTVSIGHAVGGIVAKELGGWMVICWVLVISLPFTIIPAMYYAPSEFFNFPLSVYLGFLHLSLISQLFGIFFWYKGMALGGVVRVSQIQLLQTFMTIGASALLLGERFDTLMIFFAIAIAVTIWVGKSVYTQIT